MHVVKNPGTIAIVTDATADVPLVEREAVPGVPWVALPEMWRTDRGFEMRDDGSAAPELVRAVLAPGGAPEPTEPGWDDFVAVYRRLAELDRVFSIHSPSSASWAVERAREAAGAYPNVRVVEAGVTGIGVGLLGARVRDLAHAGAGPDEIERWLRAHKDLVRMLVVPDRFDPTATQRRLSARLLDGRPLLRAGSAGGLNRSRRLRSRRATVAAIERYFGDNTRDEGELHLAIAHGDAAGAIDPFLDLLERIRPGAQVDLVGRVGPRLVQQLGSRCVAAAWVQERALDA